MKASDLCPCGTAQPYAHCCGRLHAGEAAPTAEALMRSRYTAFVLRNEPYLLATWHITRRPAHVEFNTAQKWLGLKILDSVSDGEHMAEVEFIARYRIGGASAARLHERSRFVREEGRWSYVDGDVR